AASLSTLLKEKKRFYSAFPEVFDEKNTELCCPDRGACFIFVYIPNRYERIRCGGHRIRAAAFC
ncbi:hypothetical protein, partial [Desulfovibrio piger]